MGAGAQLQHKSVREEALQDGGQIRRCHGVPPAGLSRNRSAASSSNSGTAWIYQ
jgi:hypothetical protein